MEKYNYWKIILELTTLCNYSCKWCYQKDAPIKGRPFMFLSDFERIIQEILDYPQNDLFLLLTWRGEALLHPEFSQFWQVLLKKIKDYPDKFFQIGFNTNVSFLTPQLSQLILSTCQEVEFQQIEIVLSLDVIENKHNISLKGTYFPLKKIYYYVSAFLKKAFLFNYPHFKIRLQYLVSEENYPYLWKVYLYWKDFFEKNNQKFNLRFRYSESFLDENSNYTLFFHRIDGDFSYKKIHQELEREFREKLDRNVNKNEKKSEKKMTKAEEEKLPLCLEPFSTLSIDTRGNLYLCPKDLKGELKVGNLLDEKLPQLLTSSKAQKLRQAFFSSDYLNKFTVCRYCKQG